MATATLNLDLPACLSHWAKLELEQAYAGQEVTSEAARMLQESVEAMERESREEDYSLRFWLAYLLGLAEQCAIGPELDFAMTQQREVMFIVVARALYRFIRYESADAHDKRYVRTGMTEIFEQYPLPFSTLLSPHACA